MTQLRNEESRAIRRWVVSFLCALLALLSAGGIKAWINSQERETLWAMRQAYAAESRASDAFYAYALALFHHMGGTGTREQIEAGLPDPKPVSTSPGPIGPLGERQDLVVYRHPVTGGRIEVRYDRGVQTIAGRIPAGSRMLMAAPSTQPNFTTYVSPMMHRSEQIRLGVLRTSPWLWAVALALWLFGKGRARQISSSLALLLVALAFAVSAYSFRWEYWSTWRIEKDLRLWQSGVLFVASLLVVWRSLRGSGAYDPSRCRMCGYDLRASPDRCPECGAVPVDPPQAVA